MNNILLDWNMTFLGNSLVIPITTYVAELMSTYGYKAALYKQTEEYVEYRTEYKTS